jgi:hypothetical protein
MIKEIKFVTDANLKFLTKKLKTHKMYLEYIRSTLLEQTRIRQARGKSALAMARIEKALEYVEKLLEEVK